MLRKVKFLKKITLMMLFGLNLSAQIQTVSAPNPTQQAPVMNNPIGAVRLSSDLTDVVKDGPTSYHPRFMQSYAVAEDGFPLVDGKFEFTKNELKNLSEIDVVKNALKREQRKLTKEYFEQNIFFDQLPPAVLEKHILTTSKLIDDSIDAHTDFKTLNSFTFDAYRAYLFRLGMFKLFQGQSQIQLKNKSGQKFSISHLIPKSPFEIIAMVSLLLNFIVLGYFVKSKI